ncbi:PucR family transcriptional regulator [Haloactinospora alba]|uniref:PucR family transcriptional regulator n=1 Tax=Haloactinospora alba TaxID=405555 RepID=UPI00115240E4|nr:PucR family transcriptional regulator ligand-binding domain-containing protein [Haloactinospora alba]
MPLTVGDLARQPGLQIRVVAGGAGLENEVRWAHVAELSDPVPWLRGGELVLTVGLGVGSSAEEQREYVRRLVAAGCCGLGFALDTWISHIPPVVQETAEAHGFPLLYVEGETPFVALVEAVAEHYARERLHEQQRVLSAQDAMARAALRVGSAGVLRELATATDSDAVLLDAGGMVRETASGGEREWHATVRAAVAPSSPRPRGMTLLEDGEATVLLQSLGVSGTALGWLALRSLPPLSAHTRMLANHASSLLAVGLQGDRTARRERHHERERPLALLLDGNSATRLEPDATRLIPLPAPPVEVVFYPVSHPEETRDSAADTLQDVLGDTRAADRVAMCALPDGLVVVLPGSGNARPRFGERLLTALSATPSAPSSAGACDAHGARELRNAVQRARRAAAHERGYHHVADTEAWPLLLRALDPESAAEFRTVVLGRLREHDERNGTNLVTSLRCLLEHDGNIEGAARVLGVHRNTLRARLHTAERISGRSFSGQHRMELWLALLLDQSAEPESPIESS